MDATYTQKIEELLQIGTNQYNQGEFANSLATFWEFYQLANQAKDWVNLSFAVAWLGCIYREQGDFDSAQKYFQERLNWAQVLDDFSAKWEVLNWMTEVAEREGKLADAIGYSEAQLILVRLHNIEASFEIEIVDRIGYLYFAMTNYAIAIDYLKHSAILAEKLSRDKWRANNYYTLAGCYQVLGNLGRAGDYYREAGSLYIKIEAMEFSALNCWENLRVVCRQIGDFAGAIAAEEKRLEVFRQREDRAQEFFSDYSLGSLFWESGEHSRAREYFLLALQMGKKLEEEATEEAQRLAWANQVGNAGYMLGMVEEATGRVKQAVAFYGWAIELYEQVRNEQWVRFSRQKWEWLRGRLLGSQQQGYLDFLVEVLEAVRDSKGNAKTVYSLLEGNLDKLDDGFIQALRTYIEGTLSKLKSAERGFISQVIVDFIDLIQEFSQGSKATNIEIAIAGYEAMETIFTRESDPENWAAIQNNLGLAYRNRICDDKADNLEKAIAAYNLALEVYTQKDFPINCATTQHNLGNVYLNRISGDKAENIEKAIATYNLALEVYTKKDFPIECAMVQNNLGIAYSDRILGDKAENIEKAIATYNLALEVYTKKDFPIECAMVQNNLGIAYSNRILGDKAENIEKAIAVYELAFSVRTREALPIDWATTQNNLGTAYRNRILGDKAKNIEKAIVAHNLALKVHIKKDFPIDWARTQNNLGSAYSDRILGDKAENVEKAIGAYNLALEVHTKKDFPVDWAGTQNNLGLAYSDRIFGNKAENVEKAIGAYNLALEIHTKKDFPIGWAGTQNNLGSAYRNRILGDKAENVEKAIASYQLALEIYTKNGFPFQWAMVQNNLGIAYLYRIRDDKAENIELAIVAFQLTLEVCTKNDFPIEWATTQNNLGNAYLDRIRDDKAENLENATIAFNLALSVHTLEANPIRHLETTNNLGNLHFKEGNWQPAINAYQKAITAVELSRSWLQDDYIRSQIFVEAIGVYQNIVQCYVNLQQYDKAVEYAERARSRTVAELMASKELYPNAEIPLELLEEYYRLQQLLSDLRRPTSVGTFHGTSLPDAKSRFDRRDSGKQTEQRLAEIEKIEAQRQQVWREIRKSDPVLAGQLQVDPLSIEQMRALIKDEETAILSFYTTNDDTYIFIVGRQNVQLFTCGGQGIERLQNWIGQNWLKPYVDYRNNKNQEWRKNMGAFLKELAERLQLNQLIAQHLSGIKELIIVPHIYLHQIPFAALPVDVSLTSGGGEIPPTPLGKGGYEDSILGKGSDEDSVLGKEGCREIPPTPLGKGGYLDPASPFQRGTGGGFYREFADTRLSIPTAKKPTPQSTNKPKTPETRPTYLSDIFRLRVIPSCQILSYCDNRKKSTNSQKMGIVENATGDLIFTGYECENLAQMFQVSKHHRLQYQQATVNNYRQLAKQVQFLHSSHHASANLKNPLDSKLYLFDGEVTLGDVFTWRLPELTDVFLSCCETNLTVSKLNDDILTIAAGFLSAGAQSVVSTLWAVDDSATALFCLFYYQHRQNPEYTRPQALHQAQIDLRNLTGKQLNDKYRPQLDAHLGDIETEENKKQVGKMKFNLALLCQEEYPFINPYYWAGFVSGGLQ
ncbi:MAG: tetratricopeptide repeat protein [Okeania sp. SIO3I5]|uniref:CHAT domain-containing protein n=1 Tax=Okeania sp. SIO3I5 TaxID=2607805 RepID=UPI0013BC422C|nr:CHAT domain-containing protein [Okeania sp. SIO3I5]NEQ34777.1 tetratricopeptide repeat protein [Okeania sp. SIO3I5]